MQHPDLWQSVSGQTMDFELGYLQRLVARLDYHAVIVELGVCQGRSLSAIGLACQRSGRHVYGFDDFNPENSGYVTPDEVAARANIKRLGLDEWVTIIKKDSAEAGREWTGTGVNLLFHDASHFYGKVKADLLAWMPKMAKESYIVLHDYTGKGEGQIGVSRAANELLGKPAETYPRLGMFYSADWQLWSEREK
jgi:predicted O-methyltransferase YrrM